MIANRLKSVLAAAAVIAAFTATTQAGDGWRHGGHGHDGGHAGGAHHVIGGDFRSVTVRDNHHRGRFVENSRFDRQGDGRHNRPSETDRIARLERGRNFRDGSLSVVRGVDTYAGSIYAYSIPGNGAYFVRDDNYDWRPTERRADPVAPRAKIIDVEQAMGGNAVASATACSFEAGVCVIRGN